MLILSLIIASIDIMFVGIDFANKKITLYRRYLIYLFFISFFIFLSSQLFFNHFFNLKLFPYLKSILFLWFGVSSLIKKESTNIKGPIILLLSSYIDAIIVSISFLHLYPSWFLSFSSSVISVLFLEIGYYIIKFPIKKRQQLIGTCYLIIALLSLF